MESRQMRGDRLRQPAVGIASHNEIKQRLFASARGEKVFDPAGPKFWMSADALMRLLTEENLELLAIIDREKPKSVSALANLVGREQGNVSRTIGKFERAGLVRLVSEGREKRPEIVVKHLRIDLDLASGKCSLTNDQAVSAI